MKSDSKFPKSVITLLVFCGCLLAIWKNCYAKELPADPDLVVHAGVLMDIPGTKPKLRQTIALKDGKIASVVSGYRSIPGVETLDLSSMTVLPGLIDSHVHLLSNLSSVTPFEQLKRTEAELTLDALINARKTLMAGFTTVQNVGSSNSNVIFALRDAVAKGTVLGPRIRASGTPIGVSGGHDDPRVGLPGHLESIYPVENICNGADDCRRAVRDQIRKGADLIKISVTGGVLSDSDTGIGQQITNAELAAIMEAANSSGRYVTAHAHGTDGINAALEQGVHSIEHGTFLDDESIKLFRQQGAYLVPTALAGKTIIDWASSAAWMSEAQRKKALEVGPVLLSAVGKAYRGGVKIAFGTDSGVSPHGENAHEFRLMVDAGLSPMDAIATATMNAADHLQLQDEIGSIESGKAADMIAVDGDPLLNIDVLTHVSVVIKGGVVAKSCSQITAKQTMANSAVTMRSENSCSRFNFGFGR